MKKEKISLGSTLFYFLVIYLDDSSHARKISLAKFKALFLATMEFVILIMVSALSSLKDDCFLKILTFL